MLSLLHISDLHFGPPYVPTVGEALLETVKDMSPDVVVISGDLTQRAKPEQFAEAREYLDRLPFGTRVVVPGNHDVPLYRVLERLSRPYNLYQKYIAEELDSVVHLDDAVIVALNSTHPYRAIKNGRISSKQLDFCIQAFSSAPAGAARIVVAHHHFAPAPDYEGDEILPNAKRALDTFNRLHVDLIMAGHLHRAYIGNSLDVYPGEDREHGILIVQCGTSTSRRGRVREREKNSFNWIEITDEFIRILHYMYFYDAQGFRPVSRHLFARISQGYLPKELP